MTESAVISVVDDDESIRDSTRTLLRSAGYEVATFDSGKRFLDSGALSGTRCLILDILMPGMSGLELQRRVNLSDPGVPVIFVTAHDDKANRKLAFDGGASEVFQKPFPAHDFLTAVQAALRNLVRPAPPAEGSGPAKGELEKSLEICAAGELTLMNAGRDKGMPASFDPTPTALLAEDEPILRRFVSIVLRRQGFVVISASDPAEAILLSRNRAQEIDLLLTDVSMGDAIDGFELADRIRSDAPAIRVLIMSGRLASKQLAAQKGYPFLLKPFTATALSQRVRELLPHRCRELKR